MDWIQHTKTRQVSVIAIADHRTNQPRRDRFIRHTREVFRREEVECEIWIVDPQGYNVTPLTGARKIRSARKIATAIRNASFDSIAVIDCDYPLEASHWESVSSRLRENNIVTFSHPRPIVAGYKKYLFAIYVFMMRFLLGVGKTCLNPGMVVFQKSAIRDGDLNSIADHHVDAIGQLICLSRLDHKPIIETDTTEVCNEATWGPAALEAQGPAVKVPNTKTIRSLSNQTIRFWWSKVMFPNHPFALISKQKPVSRKRKLFVWTAMIATALLVLFLRMDYPLFEPDEARNAQLAMGIVESGNWMSLTLENDAYWDKPPLLAWLTAGSYKLFGDTAWATRLPAVICSLLTFVMMLALGRRLVGFRSAAIGVGAAILSMGFVVMSRFVTMDVLLTMCVTATMLCSYIAFFGSSFRRGWCVAAGVALGLGLMAKGPVAIVLTVVPLLIYSFLQNRKFLAGGKEILWFAVPALLVAAPWYLAMCWVHPEFIEYYFWKNHVVRYSNAYIHREPFWYYLPMLLLLMFPASGLLPVVWKYFTTRKRETRTMRSTAHGFLFLYAIWILAFFSISQSKLPTYVMPAIVPICLLIGVAIEDMVFATARARKKLVSSGKKIQPFPRRRIDRLPKHMAIGLTCMIAILSAVIWFKYPESRAPLWFMLVSSLIIGALLWAVVSKSSKSRPGLAWSGFAGLGLFVIFLGIHHLVPAISEGRSIHQAVTRIKQTEAFTTAPVVFFGRDAHAMELGLEQQDVVRFSDKEIFAAAEYLKQHPQAIVVSSEDRVAMLRDGVQWQVDIVKAEDARHVYLFTPEVQSIAEDIRWERLELLR